MAYYSRPDDVQTVWQNKKPADIGTTRVGQFFGFHVDRTNVARANGEDGTSRVVHSVLGTLDLYDPEVNKLTKTSIYSIAPSQAKFGEVITQAGKARVCRIVLQEGKNMQFRRIMDIVYEQFEDNVTQYILQKLSELNVSSFDLDIDPLFDEEGAMMLAVPETTYAQNVEADVVLKDNNFRSIGMYSPCFWVRIQCEGGNANVRAGIKWNLGLRPKRKAIRWTREINVPQDEEEEEEKSSVDASVQTDEPAKKKQRRKRRKDDEEEA